MIWCRGLQGRGYLVIAMTLNPLRLEPCSPYMDDLGHTFLRELAIHEACGLGDGKPRDRIVVIVRNKWHWCSQRSSKRCEGDARANLCARERKTGIPLSLYLSLSLSLSLVCSLSLSRFFCSLFSLGPKNLSHRNECQKDNSNWLPTIWPKNAT